MAGIDKTYVNYEQLVAAVKWAISVGEVVMENGHRFRPTDFIYPYNDETGLLLVDIDNGDNEEFVLWNTPYWFDRWLVVNCPLDFVQQRLHEQYDENTLQEMANYTYNERTYVPRVTCVSHPSFHDSKWLMSNGRRKNPFHFKNKKSKHITYYIDIVKTDDVCDCLEYDAQTDTWVHSNELLPAGDEYIWCMHHKNIPTVKSIVRAIKKWHIPAGYTVRVAQNKYNGLDFEFKTH